MKVSHLSQVRFLRQRRAAPRLSIFQPLRLRFFGPASTSPIDTCLLFARLSLRTGRAASMPLAAPVRVDRCQLAGRPRFGLCATGQPDQIIRIRWPRRWWVLVAAFLPLPMNSSAQIVMLPQSSPLARGRWIHGAYPPQRRSIAGATGV